MGGELGGLMADWRALVVGLIILVAIYMAMVVLRMQRLRRKAAKPELPPQVEPSAPAAEEQPAEELPEIAATPEAAAESWSEPPAETGPAVFMQGVEAEVVQLREEVDILRGELAALRDELHNELAHLRATQTVSPLYSDAMQMATLGHDAATIAERCGISRAEAELMVALIKNQEQ